jgi:GNAT superfamily N-acetyltransferase
MPIERVDARNEDLFMEWFGVLQRSELQRDGGRGGGWQPDEWRARALDEDAPNVKHLFSLREEGTVVAVAGVEISRDDNLHSLRCDLFVEPAFVRRGFGSTLLAFVEEYGRTLGRSELLFFVIEGAEEVGVAPNRFFAPRRGYDLTDEMARRDLPWPQPVATLEALAEQWREPAASYELHRWIRSTPDSLAAPLADLMSRMGVEANHADVLVEEELWSVERLRTHEQTVYDMGRDLLVVAATHRDTGELAGYTELTVSRDDPSTAYQWDTLVARSHRGHRLGGLMKAVNLQEFARAGYTTSRITTFNSTRNQPMIDVNEALGATLAGSMAMWRKDLAAD